MSYSITITNELTRYTCCGNSPQHGQPVPKTKSETLYCFIYLFYFLCLQEQCRLMYTMSYSKSKGVLIHK